MKTEHDEQGVVNAGRQRVALIATGLPAIPVMLGWLPAKPGHALVLLRRFLQSWKDPWGAAGLSWDLGEECITDRFLADNRFWDASLVCLAFLFAYLSLRGLERNRPPFRTAKIVSFAACILSSGQAALSLIPEKTALATLYVLVAVTTALASTLYLWLLCESVRRWASACGMIGFSYLAGFCGWTSVMFSLMSLDLSLAGAGAFRGYARIILSFPPMLASFVCVPPGTLLCVCLLFLVLYLGGRLSVPRLQCEPVAEMNEDNGHGVEQGLWTQIFGYPLALSTEQRRGAAGLWYVLFMAAMFAGSVGLGITALYFTKVPEDQHWREVLVPTVVTRVYETLLVGLVLPAAGAAWCVGHMLADSPRRRRWAMRGLSLVIVPMELWLGVSWWMASVLPDEPLVHGATLGYPSCDYLALFAKLAMVAYPVAAVIVAWAAFRVTRAIVLRQGTVWR